MVAFNADADLCGFKRIIHFCIEDDATTRPLVVCDDVMVPLDAVCVDDDRYSVWGRVDMVRSDGTVTVSWRSSDGAWNHDTFERKRLIAGNRRVYVCELRKSDHGLYGQFPIIEHRQGLVQWMEHRLTRAELGGLAVLRTMSDRPSGIHGLSKELVVENAMLTRLRSLGYASDGSGLWCITDKGSEVLRLRYDSLF